MSKIRTISNEQRDTHFKNYARIVFDDVEDLFIKLATTSSVAEKMQLTNDIQLSLAGRIYDVACQVADELVGEDGYSIDDLSDYPLRSDYPKK